MLRFLLNKPYRSAAAAAAGFFAVAAVDSSHSAGDHLRYPLFCFLFQILTFSLKRRNLISFLCAVRVCVCSQYRGDCFRLPPSAASFLILASELIWENYRFPSLFSIPLAGRFSSFNLDFRCRFPLRHSFVDSSVPSATLNKEASGKSEDDSRCCPGCLGRKSIVKAAATAGPAVHFCRIYMVNFGYFVDFQSTRGVSKGKVGVTLQDGREFEGTVVNADLHSDIAVLQPGDWVVALGCPLSLQNTITSGIVSCVDRKSSDLGLGGVRREYLQTDCAIRGNSGGPLVNLDGEVVGINVMKVAAADGLSFAVPIDSVVKIIEHFKKRGRVVRPWLGLKMLDLNEMIVAQLKERDDSFQILSFMLDQTPGSAVVEFEGKCVEGVKEIVDIMGDKVGQPLKVLVKRTNNKSAMLTVIPEEADTGR
uniref:Protease Do-like 14 n=1 Tax=Ananas comosus var. bracteatus TaxID=296719 RepID=A0A6V7NMQ5_ANACO|nr:unnamed protein product [Ananas comosus var. bracteatus]